jgi:hypothetical protein
MVNFIGQLVVLTPRAELYSIGLWSVAAILVTAIWGARALTRTSAWHLHSAKTTQPAHSAGVFALPLMRRR